MPINRRSEQEVSTIEGGATARVLTSSNTGSKMLTVLEINLAPGSGIAYRTNDSHEESFLIRRGDVRFKFDGSAFNLTAGDCVYVAKGIPCGAEASCENGAVIVSVCPHPDPERSTLDEPALTDAVPGDNVMIRADIEPYDFAPGVKRVDMVGDFRGATSTYWSELAFEPGATTPNHFHPAHEESMLCIEGNLSAVYGDDEGIPLPAGDMFMCEPTVRHTTNNLSDAPGKLLAIHPVLNPPPRVLVD